ncbi:ben domain-containing protein 6-like protein [Lasius niger]|uniref:Ben domain-containing protein 6-like protein n=1 Tax=Lasius niger TaxID=67767 RepID=A0A0J7K1G3_LASNI|nr:ben domain-containing protein 6-like protein [Lasius niger]
MISFSSKSLSLATVQKARHSKLSILATELCSLVFTTRELALCSLKGKKTNAHKNAFQKQAIDEEKVKGIIEYIAKYFSKSPDDIQDEVYKAIENKFNNFSKILEGKRIINEHLAERAAQEQSPQQQQQVEANQQQIAATEQHQEQAALQSTGTQ